VDQTQRDPYHSVDFGYYQIVMMMVVAEGCRYLGTGGMVSVLVVQS